MLDYCGRYDCSDCDRRCLYVYWGLKNGKIAAQDRRRFSFFKKKKKSSKKFLTKYGGSGILKKLSPREAAGHRKDAGLYIEK